MNYYEIGQQIRKYRREKGLSQEQLAEAANISVTHMSHIETGNTKLSLPVLVDIASTLNVSCDRLLNTLTSEDTAVKNLLRTLADFTPRQINMLADIAAVIKKAGGKNM